MEDPAFIRPDHSSARSRSCLWVVLLVCATMWLVDAAVRRSAEPRPAAVEHTYAVLSPEQASAAPTIKPPDPEYTRQVRRTAHLYEAIIGRVAQRYGVDPALVRAIIMAESAYDPRAVSHRGAQGLMQLMPETAAMLGVADGFDPEHNITGGVRYFRQLYDRFDRDPALALAAYNAGPGKVLRHQGIPPYQATRRYVKKVLAYYQCYRQVGSPETGAEDA